MTGWLALWFLASIPAGVVVGAFIRASRGDRKPPEAVVETAEDWTAVR